MRLFDLPNELLFDIVALLSVQAIIRLSQTSKQFLQLGMDRGLWDQLYNNSYLLRPPGPFAYQSSRDLAIALFKSEKMDAAWSWAASPSASPTPVNKRILTDYVNENSHLALLLGRWLLVGGDPGVQVYDLDAAVDWPLSVGNIKGKIRQLLSTASTDGAGVHSAYVATLSAQRDFTPMLDVNGDLLVLVSTWGDITVRNIRTNQGYEIPHPQFELPSDHLSRFFCQTLVTPTHLIIAYVLDKRPTWFEVLPLPSESSPASSESVSLSVSHRGHAGLSSILNITLLSSTASRVIVMATQHALSKEFAFILELQLEENGLLNSVVLHRQHFPNNLPYYMHISAGTGSVLSARGVGFRGHMASSTTQHHALRILTDPEEESGYTIDVCKQTLSVQSVPGSTAFDGYRGRLAYVHIRQIIILDYI
ncbi:hypothetical protein HWV62_44707 [Athelia sp. TMB]|nr:hypothetical protein HWV62_44707 [Athelia sp. TMB]